jgi:hypothetical protein
MIQKLGNNKVEVEYLRGCQYHKKQININHLNKFVFSKGFKELLKRYLSKNDDVLYNDFYCIINYRKYDYDEIVEEKYFQYLCFNNYSSVVIIRWIDYLLHGHPMEIRHLFLIKNYIANMKLIDSISKLGHIDSIFRTIWEKTKHNY